MPITLAEIELTGVQDIKTDETRSLVKHRVPGMEGDLVQNLGRRPTSISFAGIFKGEEALNHIETLRQKFKTREPAAFVSDITDSTDVTNVVIENFRVQQVGGRPDYYTYTVSLKEYLEIVEEEVTQEIEEEQRQEAEDEHTQKEEEIEKNQVTLEVRVKLEQGETDYSNFIVDIYNEADIPVATVTKHEEGVYRREGLPTGVYKAVVRRR
jgi:hypothetical protein